MSPLAIKTIKSASGNRYVSTDYFYPFSGVQLPTYSLFFQKSRFQPTKITKYRYKSSTWLHVAAPSFSKDPFSFSVAFYLLRFYGLQWF